MSFSATDFFLSDLNQRQRNFCTYMGHYFPVGFVRLCILKRWSSSPQTGVNLASQPQTIPLTQLFHSSSFLFFHSGGRSPAQLSQFGFTLTSLSSTPICVGLRICWLVSKLPRLWIFPSLVCLPLSCCLPVLLFFLFFVFSLCLFRAEVSAPQYQSVGHSGADQSISGTGSFRGEGGEILGASPSYWKIANQDKC